MSKVLSTSPRHTELLYLDKAGSHHWVNWNPGPLIPKQMCFCLFLLHFRLLCLNYRLTSLLYILLNQMLGLQLPSSQSLSLCLQIRCSFPDLLMYSYLGLSFVLHQLSNKVECRNKWQILQTLMYTVIFNI